MFKIKRLKLKFVIIFEETIYKTMSVEEIKNIRIINTAYDPNAAMFFSNPIYLFMR